MIGFFSAMGNTSQREISYDKFLKLVSEHKVKEVKLDSEKIYITLTDKAREEAREKAVEKAEKEGRLSPFEEAMESGEVLKGTVTAALKGGLSVSYPTAFRKKRRERTRA